MTSLGVPPLTAHFFIFYGTLLSALTPPVCTAVYTAAVITGTHWWPIALVSMKLGVMKFVLLFFFIYRPAVPLQGSTLEIMQATAVGGVAAFLFAIGAGGFHRRRIAWPLRVLAVAVAAGTVADQPLLDVVALVVLAMVLLLGRAPPPDSVATKAGGVARG